MFLFLFLFFSMLLQCSFFRLKELFKVKNGLTTSLLFFENAKNLGRLDDAKRKKKRGWPEVTGKMAKLNSLLLFGEKASIECCS